MTVAGAARSYVRALLAIGRWRVASILGIGALAALTEGAAVLLLVPMLGSVGVAGAGEDPWVATMHRLLPDGLGLGGVLVLWTGIVCAHAALVAWRDRQMAEVQHGFADHCRTRLFDAASGMEWQAFVRHRSADILHALTALQARITLGTGQVLQVGVQGLLMLTYVAIALLVEPWGGVLVVVAGGLLAVLQLPRFRRAFGHGRAEIAGGRAVHALVSDHLAGMQMAKSWGAERRQAAVFAAASARMAATALAAASARAQGLLALRASQAVLVALGLWICLAWLELRGPSLLLIAAVPLRLLPVFVGLVQAIRLIAEMLPAWDESETLLRRFRQAVEPVTVAVASPVGPITLRGVGFSWAAAGDAPTVSGIQVTIPEHRTTALIGRSGAGKSTLAAIVLGLLAPTCGEVRVGGTTLEGGARRAWRSRAAYVPQEVFLLNDTVRANLAWAKPDAGEAAMWQALECAAVADVVRQLPQGLDTVLGDRGAAVSGGERQRLTIAQALLREPELLVLDEATSHLDRENERAIQEALRRLHGRVTVLLVAHRLSTVRDADLVLVLEDGRLVEQGTWSALIERQDSRLHRLAMASDL